MVVTCCRTDSTFEAVQVFPLLGRVCWLHIYLLTTYQLNMYSMKKHKDMLATWLSPDVCVSCAAGVVECDAFWRGLYKFEGRCYIEDSCIFCVLKVCVFKSLPVKEIGTECAHCIISQWKWDTWLLIPFGDLACVWHSMLSHHSSNYIFDSYCFAVFQFTDFFLLAFRGVPSLIFAQTQISTWN